MERDKVSEWPYVKANVSPATKQNIRDAATRRALPASAVIREALEALFGDRPSEPS
jgi:hypothetical protein